MMQGSVLQESVAELDTPIGMRRSNMIDDFIDYRAEVGQYRTDFPVKRMELSDGAFEYVLAGPDDAKHTLVFLNGGMNCSEMWMRYVKGLSDEHRVLAFDFPIAYGTDQALCAGIHELIIALGLGRVVLVGASFGGFLAQIYAKGYPDDVEAMCLMSTGGLTENAMRKYGRLLKLVGVAMAVMRIMPYGFTVKMERRLSDSYIKEAAEDERQYFSDMFDDIYAGYTKEKDLHVEALMRDLGNQEPASASDFRGLAGRVMLLLPEDDGAFPEELQDELKDVMTDPIIVPGIEGGHLATLLHSDEYIGHIHSLLSDLQYR